MIALRRLIVVAVAAACAGAGAAAIFAQGSGPSHAPKTILRERQAVHRLSQKDGKTIIVRGPRGRRGRRGRQGPTGPAGPTGPQGPAGQGGTDFVQDLGVNWNGGNWQGHDTASAGIASIGTLTITCNPSQQRLTLVPASGAVRTVMTLTTFQGAGSFDNSLNNRYVSNDGSPIVVDSTMPNQPFPINGMINGTLSVEPISGDGGSGPAPAALTLSSYAKVNDPTPQNNLCYVSAQVLRGG